MLEKIIAALSSARSQHAAGALGIRQSPEPALYECGRLAGFYQGLLEAENLVRGVFHDEESREDDEPDFKP